MRRRPKNWLTHERIGDVARNSGRTMWGAKKTPSGATRERVRECTDAEFRGGKAERVADELRDFYPTAHEKLTGEL